MYKYYLMMIMIILAIVRMKRIVMILIMDVLYLIARPTLSRLDLFSLELWRQRQ